MVATAVNPNRYVWYDINSPDIERAVAFYTDLFGWTAEAMPLGGGQVYYMWKNGDANFGGGVQTDPSQGDMSYWIGYISTPGVDDVARRAEGKGATVIVPPSDIPDIGRFSVFRDPQGAHFSAITLLPTSMQAPDGLAPVNSILWNELIVDDPAAGATFYGDLFGWTSRSMPDPNGGPNDYTLLGRGELPNGQPVDAGGILKRPEMVSVPNWTFYVHVADVNATVAKATELGGNILAPVFEVPGIGLLAVIQDPTGAVIALIQPTWPDA